jgi:hypothetical protein
MDDTAVFTCENDLYQRFGVSTLTKTMKYLNISDQLAQDFRRGLFYGTNCEDHHFVDFPLFNNKKTAGISQWVPEREIKHFCINNIPGLPTGSLQNAYTFFYNRSHSDLKVNNLIDKKTKDMDEIQLLRGNLLIVKHQGLETTFFQDMHPEDVILVEFLLRM